MQPGVIRLEPFGIGSGYGIGSGELLWEAWTCAKSSESYQKIRGDIETIIQIQR